MGFETGAGTLEGLGGRCNTSGWGASFEGLGWPDPAVGCPGSTSCVQAGSEPYAAGLGRDANAASSVVIQPVSVG